jgi:H+-transporting ATPase
LGIFKLSYCVGVLAAGWFWLGFGTDQMRTLTFVTLVLAGQANTYVLRTKRPFWLSRPAPVMLLVSLADVSLVAVLAADRWPMTPLSPLVLAMLMLATLGFAVTMDALKRLVFSQLEIDRRQA